MRERCCCCLPQPDSLMIAESEHGSRAQMCCGPKTHMGGPSTCMTNIQVLAPVALDDFC